MMDRLVETGESVGMGRNLKTSMKVSILMNLLGLLFVRSDD